MGKHTPGPWRVEGRMYVLGGKLAGHIISRGINDHGDGPQSYVCKAEGTTEEDARLMAAAPDLFEVAKGVANMKLIDAEDVNGEIVFRFSVPGRQLFNPPKFVVDARALVAALSKAGE